MQIITRKAKHPSEFLESELIPSQWKIECTNKVSVYCTRRDECEGSEQEANKWFYKLGWRMAQLDDTLYQICYYCLEYMKENAADDGFEKLIIFEQGEK